MVWSGEDCTSLVTVVDDALRLWKLDASCAATQGAAATFGAGIAKTEAGCFDPHHAAQFASAHDRSLRAWDFRTAKCVFPVGVYFVFAALVISSVS